MRIDPATLSIVALSVSALTGLMLVFAWRQMPDATALAWWGAAFLTIGLGVGSLAARFLLSSSIPIAVSCVAVCAGGGLLWAGCRAFEHRSVPAGGVMVGAVLWLAACGVPEVYKSAGLGVAVALVLFSAYALAGAVELWRGRGERLGSRMPATILLAVHALVLASLVPEITGGGDLRGFAAERLSAHATESLVFAIAAALLFVALAGERRGASETDADLDPATQALTRDAFFTRGRAFLEAARREKRACVLLHARLEIGDAQSATAESLADGLAAFCDVVREAVPLDAIVARFGQDEIACLLGAPDASAWSTAERIRRDFETKHFTEAVDPLTTASIGVVTTGEAGHVLHALLAAADLALVFAAADGGNRVARLEVPDLGSPDSWSAGDLVAA